MGFIKQFQKTTMNIDEPLFRKALEIQRFDFKGDVIEGAYKCNFTALLQLIN